MLSEPSIVSLNLQGGPMSEAECQEFEQNANYLDAVQLRRFDDLAKVPNMEVRPLTAYLVLIEDQLK
jgi:predicted HD phosphohydrolase